MTDPCVGERCPICSRTRDHLDRVQCGETGDRHADGREVLRAGQVESLAREDHVLAVNVRVAGDLGDAFDTEALPPGRWRSSRREIRPSAQPGS